MGKEKTRLLGIKAIADYLNTSERNIYRWEKELGLPLQRIAGSKGRTVYADVDDIEKWLENRKSSLPLKQKSFLNNASKLVFLFIAIGAVIVLSIYIYKKSSKELSNPVAFSLEDTLAYIKDQNGKSLWTVIHEDSYVDLKTYNPADFSDVDNDGANEVIARIYDSDNDKFHLTLYDNDGSEIWDRHITNEQKFKGIELKSNFIPMIIKFAPLSDKEKCIVTHWRHRVRFLSLISCHDCKGKLLGKYAHVGNLCSMQIHDINGDGNYEIIFSGTNNLLDGEGVLGVLPLKDFRGVNPPNRIEPEYSHLAFRLQSYIAKDPEPGNQLIYLRFKKSNHLEQHQKIYMFASLDNIDSHLIQVLLEPLELDYYMQPVGFEYVFDNNFRLMDIIPNVPLRKYYPMLIKNREIDITLEELIDIYAKNVLRWENGSWVPVNK